MCSSWMTFALDGYAFALFLDLLDFYFYALVLVRFAFSR